MAAVGGMGLRPGLWRSVCAAGGLPGVGGRQVLWRHIQLGAGRHTNNLQQLCLFALVALLAFAATCLWRTSQSGHALHIIRLASFPAAVPLGWLTNRDCPAAQFNTAGRSIGCGLLAVDLVSHWCESPKYSTLSLHFHCM